MGKENKNDEKNRKNENDEKRMKNKREEISTTKQKKRSVKQSGNIRHWFQAAWCALTNGYVMGYVEGKIYRGKSKLLCVPGLNCYSCPGALGSCPIGSLQAVLSSPKFTVSCYVFGFLILFGSLFGRLVCGWLCPFGLVQDLIYKIPFPVKKKNMPGHKYLRYLKWGILVVFVCLLPAVVTGIAGVGDPWFCKYICPSGTLFGALPLITVNEGLRAAVGKLFQWKVLILVAVLLWSVVYYRPFCKYLCPLGAWYGSFHPLSLYRFHIDKDACISCGACQKACKMDIPVWKQPNSPECIRCQDCRHVCPTGAIKTRLFK